MATIELGITSADAITLAPEYDFRRPKKQVRSEHRVPSGRLWEYKWGDFQTFKFQLNHIAEMDASVINSWFDDRTELLLFITSSTVTEVHSVMIRNKETPLAQYNRPYNNLYRGSIQLEGY